MTIARKCIIPARLGLVALLAAGGTACAQNPQVVQAQADMAALETALVSCVIHTTYYVSLENLNDTASLPGAQRPFDSIQDQGGVYVMLPDVGTFQPNRKNLATVQANQWQGPYVNFPQGRTQEGATPYDLGSLFDPWDTPYYFFNPLGLIRGDQGIVTLELYGDQFDRYTIVSLGPDGVVSSDDLFRQMNAFVNSTHLTSLRGPGVTRTSAPQDPPAYDVEAGSTVILRGINFGSAAPNKRVVFNDQTIPHTGWSNREVEIVVPQELTGTGNFRIMIGAGGTETLPANITGGDTTVRDWKAYE